MALFTENLVTQTEEAMIDSQYSILHCQGVSVYRLQNCALLTYLQKQERSATENNYHRNRMTKKNKIKLKNKKRHWKKKMITANTSLTQRRKLVHRPRQTASLCNHTFACTSDVIVCLPHYKIIGRDFEIFHVTYTVIRYYKLCIYARRLFST
jgi:hypothetical protein